MRVSMWAWEVILPGGHVLSLFQVMVGAVQASKLRWRLEDDTQKPLTVDEVFYLGTKGGGAFFGQVGALKKGMNLTR